MTRYIQIHEKEPRGDLDHRAKAFTPWLNCDNDTEEMTAKLALNKHLRESGGLSVGESIYLVAWVYDDTTPTHDNGNPMAVNRFDFKFTRQPAL